MAWIRTRPLVKLEETRTISLKPRWLFFMPLIVHLGIDIYYVWHTVVHSLIRKKEKNCWAIVA